MPTVRIKSTKEILEELTREMEANPQAVVPVSVVHQLAVHLAQVENKIGGTAVSG